MRVAYASACLLLFLTWTGCQRTGAVDVLASAPAVAAPSAAQTRRAAPTVPPVASCEPRAPVSSPVPQAPKPPVLPDAVVPGEEVKLEVPGDRPVLVVHAPPGVDRAMVYLHGVCGDVFAIRSWATRVSAHGTLVAMLGDSPCRNRPGRFRWTRRAGQIDERIRATLEAVKAARGGLLRTDQVLLIGYSQGADRVERLVQAFPQRYPRAILGSPPSAPAPEQLTQAAAVAVVAGAREGNRLRREGVEALDAAGIRATFMPLPAAGHGEYGPDAERVMGEALEWILGDPACPGAQRPGTFDIDASLVQPCGP